MKKYFISLVAVSICMAFSANAQWQFSGENIYNINTGNVGIGISSPGSLLDVARNMTEPTISVRNLGGSGGATFRIFDQSSGGDWKLKTTNTGGFRLRDHYYGVDVIQIEPNSEANMIYIKNNGNLGVGIDIPTSLLDVAKSMTEPTISVRNLGANGGATFRMSDNNSGGDWKFKVVASGGFKIRDQANALDVIQIEANSEANVIYINSAGNLGVGTANPTEKLSINGNIKCKQVEVSLTGWSDFVFDDDYTLLPLKELESFIKTNKHLPGVPTADAILTNGANLGEIDAILLQKIEELTLYVIELKKENEELRSLLIR